jgi:prevent-host-death family protein
MTDSHQPNGESRAIPELVPLSALRARQGEVLAKLRQGPLVLTQHGRAVAVLVSPEEWNALHQDLQRLARALVAPPEETGDFYDFLGGRGLSSAGAPAEGEGDEDG